MENVVILRLDETKKAIIQNCANFKDFYLVLLMEKA